MTKTIGLSVFFTLQAFFIWNAGAQEMMRSGVSNDYSITYIDSFSKSIDSLDSSYLIDKLNSFESNGRQEELSVCVCERTDLIIPKIVSFLPSDAYPIHRVIFYYINNMPVKAVSIRILDSTNKRSVSTYYYPGSG